MKTFLLLAGCCFLLAGCSSMPLDNVEDTAAPMSKADPEKLLETIRDIKMRAQKLRLEAEARAMEQCQTERIVVPLPEFDIFTGTETTQDTIISLTWSGACVDGTRDGHGMLGWIEEQTTNTRISETTNLEMRIVWTNTAEGRFVKGQRLGLWCMTRKSQVFKDGLEFGNPRSNSGCSVFAGHTNPLTSNYLKKPDGSWIEYADEPTDSTLAAGTLEAQSAKVLADAAAGKTDLKAELVVHNRALDDLVRGSKIVLAPSTEPISLKDKRIAIVLSSQAVSELERFRRERQALIEASAGLRGEAAAQRAKFIQASDPDRLLVNILKVVRKYAKGAQPADDLSDLKREGFDYALVVDWKSLTRFDQLGKYDSFPIPSEEASRLSMIAAVSKGTPVFYGILMGGFLISRDLKAVKHFPAHMLDVGIKPSRPIHSGITGDQAYFGLLALYFEHGLGNGRDDLGKSTQNLDSFLKHLDDTASSTQ